MQCDTGISRIYVVTVTKRVPVSPLPIGVVQLFSGTLKPLGKPTRQGSYGLAQKPCRQTRPVDPQPASSVQGRGHGPTAFTGADVNSVFEPTPQKMSTGRPSQPQRPPGSMQRASLLRTMHLPLLAQPPAKPQR